MKVHMVRYNFSQIFFSKSKIHILPISEQRDLKTAIVLSRKLKFPAHNSKKPIQIFLLSGGIWHFSRARNLS